ncbi:MAG TPA: hypothetical protein DEB31_05520 [Clostridiales bacterium]|nr:hypothetical protein [Clostridiales bacterium]
MVHVVSGPVSIAPPEGVRVTSVQSAAQMFDAVMEAKADADIVIACAAVSDYAPKEMSGQKLKKTDGLVLELVKTKDILAALGKEKSYYLCGFAAETQNVEEYAREKLRKKNLDMIVANDVSGDGIGFDSADNEVVIFKKDGSTHAVGKAGKDQIAREILREIARDLDG